MRTIILNKILSLYILIRYGRLPADIKYYYRDTYSCNLRQLRYFFKDYLIKPKYKNITFSGEFTPDLVFALPFAYWHYKNGTLLSTTGAKLTKDLYFFSENHTELFPERTIEGNYNYETPRILYSQDYNMSKWAKVPLKDYYKNEIFVFDKPILIIANRYNMEWNGPPISFLSIELLDYIIVELRSKYTIVYNRPNPQHIINDNSVVYDLNEHDWLRKTHPDVILMEDLFEENKSKVKNYNHFQLMVYANSECFISTHGGTAALASYFGGVNIILSKKGPEHHFKCFEKLYPKLANTRIFHAKTDEELKDRIAQNF